MVKHVEIIMIQNVVWWLLVEYRINIDQMRIFVMINMIQTRP